MRVFPPVILWSVLCAMAFSACAASEKEFDANLRSAFLGPGVWSNNALGRQEIQHQLTDHFKSVLEILRQQTDASLTAATDRLINHDGQKGKQNRIEIYRQLRQQRINQIQTLSQYAKRGLFPRNEGYDDQAVPIFVDASGIHCAVGYLMHRSGNDHIVDEIVGGNNLIFVDEIQSGEALDWILRSGLTQSEAAMIQPSYSPPAFDATLADFESPGFSISESGVTVSELQVLRYSFQRNGASPELFQLLATSGVDADGVDFPNPEDFGIAIGEGVHDPGKGKKLVYVPNFNNWVFVGGIDSPLGSPDAGDDTVVYRIQYSVSVEVPVVANMTVASSGIFNANFLFGLDDLLVIESRALENDGAFLSEGVIQANGEDFILDASAFFQVGRKEFRVSNYVIDFRSDDFGFGFTSLWNEFEVVVLGDVNCDGAVNLLDVGPFVDALTNDFPDVKADINQDGSDDLMDVAGFVELLGAGG